jgi:hypothetical protein
LLNAEALHPAIGYQQNDGEDGRRKDEDAEGSRLKTPGDKKYGKLTGRGGDDSD